MMAALLMNIKRKDGQLFQTGIGSGLVLVNIVDRMKNSIFITFIRFLWEVIGGKINLQFSVEVVILATIICGILRN